MYLDISGKDIMHTFDSIHEYLTYASDTDTDMSQLNRSSRKTEKEFGSNFFGTRTYADAVELAYKGYPAAREHGEPVRELAMELISPHIIKPKPAYDKVGDIIDVPRYLSGMPDDFIIRYEPDTGLTDKGKSSKVFRICVNLTYVCHTTPTEITIRGAAIVALIDLLEQHHKRVEVLGVMSVSPVMEYNSTSKLQNYLTIKEAGQPLDIDFLYFVLAHPAMLRRFGFSVWETYPMAIRNAYGIPGSYGRVDEPNIIVDTDIYFPHLIDRTPFRNKVSTLKWVLSHLQKQGAISAEAAELVIQEAAIRNPEIPKAPTRYYQF